MYMIIARGTLCLYKAVIRFMSITSVWAIAVNNFVCVIVIQ